MQGADKGEVPVGAVLVHNGEVLAAEHNRVEETSDPTAHAEMLCLQRAAARRENWRLLQSALYVTLEPCPMCAGAILLSRVSTIIYGTSSPLLGKKLACCLIILHWQGSNDGQTHCAAYCQQLS